jgi:hypothetical protein
MIVSEAMQKRRYRQEQRAKARVHNSQKTAYQRQAYDGHASEES